ncbi:uncharacterized protein DUF1648 [Leucobacter luti]|uniref:Uncharacterized protein DUF1648 n=1 Tax=Leucobacter luti TaxID=340320 RepID=A0A4R6S7M3_9MICO|nr:DUF1648 domain-containing protein [Leucobacter luti]TDP95852.1 uncharacterized protein DUF1648 [Leucobacter luti]
MREPVALPLRSSEPAAHDHSEADRASLDRARRAARWTGLYLPLSITLAMTGIMLLWLPRMPDPAAVHWGLSGEPDGFDSPWVNALMLPGIGLMLTGISCIQATQLARGRQHTGGPSRASSYRLIPAVVLGSVVLIASIGIGTSWVQLDAADARDTGSTLGVLVGGGVAAVAVSVLAYFAQPRLQSVAAQGGGAEALSLASTEHAVWVRDVRAARSFVWTVGAAFLLLATMTVLVFFADPVGGWIMAGTLVFVAVVALPMTVFRVRVDGSGLVARSLCGWPTVRVPAADVSTVTVAEVQPFAEYGGWGLRFVPGTTALVLRTGEALIITRRSGRTLVVTVDDAETAAALLSSAASRAAEAQLIQGTDTGGEDC